MIVDALKEALSSEMVLSDPADLELYKTDVFVSGDLPLCVVLPICSSDVVKIVSVCAHSGVVIVPRGAGASYTGGVVKEGSYIVVDCSNMNKIIEIDIENRVVIVESGCSWEKLSRELAKHKLRTPYWGTLSGLRATIGGSVSQNSLFWGSARYGASGDSVIGMEVVVGTGEVLRCGNWARKLSKPSSKPFMRNFGIDYCGLFCGDCGALGIKTAIALKLIPTMMIHDGVSFEFDSSKELLSAMSCIGRAGIATEIVGFDPHLAKARLKRESLMKDAVVLKETIKHEKTFIGAIKQFFKFAYYGRRGFNADSYNLHLLTEANTTEEIKYALNAMRKIALKYNGIEVPNLVPKALRANPFTPLNNMLGALGERWLPIHGLVPHAIAHNVMEKIENMFDDYRSKMKECGVHYSLLFSAMGCSVVVLEPVFYWEDELYPIHKKYVEPDYLSKLPTYEYNLKGRNLVMEMKSALIDIFKESSAAHLQIARTYPYLETMGNCEKNLIQDIKKLFDPRKIFNSGSLGL